MSDLIHVTDHVERGRAKLIGQYQGKPRIQAFVDAFSRQIQEIEDAIFDLFSKRLLDGAVGAQLDNIGAIVGYLRAGSLDDEYRLLLRARIKVNLSNGKLENLIQILKLITGQPIAAREYYPAALELEVNSVTANARRISNDFLQRAKAGGVSLHFIHSDEGTGSVFEFSDATDDVSATQGFEDSVSSTFGGDLAGMFGEK